MVRVLRPGDGLSSGLLLLLLLPLLHREAPPRERYERRRRGRRLSFLSACRRLSSRAWCRYRAARTPCRARRRGPIGTLRTSGTAAASKCGLPGAFCTTRVVNNGSLHTMYGVRPGSKHGLLRNRLAPAHGSEQHTTAAAGRMTRRPLLPAQWLTRTAVLLPVRLREPLQVARAAAAPALTVAPAAAPAVAAPSPPPSVTSHVLRVPHRTAGLAHRRQQSRGHRLRRADVRRGRRSQRQANCDPLEIGRATVRRCGSDAAPTAKAVATATQAGIAAAGGPNTVTARCILRSCACPQVSLRNRRADCVLCKAVLGVPFGPTGPVRQGTCFTAWTLLRARTLQ